MLQITANIILWHTAAVATASPAAAVRVVNVAAAGGVVVGIRIIRVAAKGANCCGSRCSVLKVALLSCCKGTHGGVAAALMYLLDDGPMDSRTTEVAFWRVGE